METPYYVRNHNTFTSGNCLSYPAGGSTNIYTEDENGNPIYNFSIIDQIYDNYIENNFIPIVELDFMPFDLVPNKNKFKSDYQLTGWKYPPKDFNKWKNLIETFINHLYQRYGKQIENWYFEVWNEPNISNYWLGSFEDYFKLYDYSVQAVKTINQNLKIGGPALATTDSSESFFNQFLEHITNGTNYANNQIGTKIDFISFHTKG
jgi:xylan 1,4-beta-xylosidase